MSISTFTAATQRSRALPMTHAMLPTLPVCITDAVPADNAGRGIYANSKQDRPPRDHLR